MIFYNQIMTRTFQWIWMKKLGHPLPMVTSELDVYHAQVVQIKDFDSSVDAYK